MLLMCPAGYQCDLHVGDRRACQDTSVLLFLQMGQDQSLPVSGKDILTAVSLKLQTAPRLSRLKQKVYLGIMPQRFKMPYSLYRVGNGFLIHNSSFSKSNLQSKAFPDQYLQDLHLNLAHDMHMDLLKLLFPGKGQRRILFLQLLQLWHHRHWICSFRKQQAITQYRCQKWAFQIFLHAKSLSRHGSKQSCHRADTACRSLIHCFKPFS